MNNFAAATFECRHPCETGDWDSQFAAGCHGDGMGNAHDDQFCFACLVANDDGDGEPPPIEPCLGAPLQTPTSRGTVTSTEYTDGQCTARATECGPDNVYQPYNGDECAEEDITIIPSDSIAWESGVCVPPCTGRECNWPFISADDDIGQMLASQGVDATYTKITCADGATIVEHFSDAACTAASKVSGDELNAAVVAGFNQMMTEQLAGSGMEGILDCMHVDLDLMSGVSISGTHCDTVVSRSFDEVRRKRKASCLGAPTDEAGCADGVEPSRECADLNSDGRVSTDDLLSLLAQFGREC